MGNFRGLWTIAMVVIAVLVIVVCGNHAVLAQGTSAGSIQGTVTDASGAAIAGVAVTITNIQTSASRTLTTADDGRYTALNLPVTSYLVKAEKSGFGAKINENVQVNPGIATVLDIQLSVGTVTETVDVQATIAPVTEDKPDRGVVIQAATLQTLPLQISGGQRQSDTFLTLAPGVTGDTFSARINGAPNFSQEFYYDCIPFMNG